MGVPFKSYDRKPWCDASAKWSGVFSSDALEFLVKSGPVFYFAPQTKIWRRSGQGEPTFSIVLEGAVGEWYNNYKEDSLDSVVLPGQVIGEFSSIGSSSQNFGAISLAHTTLLPCDAATMAQLQKHLGLEEFYLSIARSLDGRLKGQNRLLKVRTGQVHRRLAKLFDMFNRDWLVLKTNKDRNITNEFMIEMFFDPKIISGFVSSHSRVVGAILRDFAKEGTLKIHKVDSSFTRVESESLLDRWPTEGFPSDFGCFQIEITSGTGLARRTGYPV